MLDLRLKQLNSFIRMSSESSCFSLLSCPVKGPPPWSVNRPARSEGNNIPAICRRTHGFFTPFLSLSHADQHPRHPNPISSPRPPPPPPPPPSSLLLTLSSFSQITFSFSSERRVSLSPSLSLSCPLLSSPPPPSLRFHSLSRLT